MILREEGVDKEQEDYVSGFLRVKLVCNTETGLLEFLQDELIDRVIKSLILDYILENVKCNPSESKPLIKDTDGLQIHEKFSCSSVVVIIL